MSLPEPPVIAMEVTSSVVNFRLPVKSLASTLVSVLAAPSVRVRFLSPVTVMPVIAPVTLTVLAAVPEAIAKASMPLVAEVAENSPAV